MSEASPAQPVTEPSEAAAAPADQAPVAKLAQRDGAIALAALSFFAAADAWHAASGLGFAAALALADAIVVGVALGTLAHEWGHFAGARLSGGIAPTRGIRSFFPIFDMDLQKSEPAAFRAMSVGGNVGHWAVVLVFLAFVPLDSPGRIALLASSFGFAVSASTTEFPIIGRAFRGASAAESFAGLTGDTLRRNNWIGAAAGLVLFAVI
ncbi:MAG: hypothetical protein JRH10_20320 [Deltaproteobacteria bacterium]|nr:hypothetical protein [Deltaproteobacteria bacterium]MBW2448521.1 hypothetical protein [Deltaproteobacteria bacterium]